MLFRVEVMSGEVLSKGGGAVQGVVVLFSGKWCCLGGGAVQ